MGDLVVALGDQRYAVVRPWGVLPADIAYGVVSHVAVDSRDNVYVFQRGDPPVVVFDPAGAFVRSWGSGLIADPHGIFITPDDLVVLVDRDGHQVMGFDASGSIRFTLGDRGQPRLQAPFNHPADVAVASNGDIYVADGYANSAVHRFSSDGELKQSWGRPGHGPGEFTTPHAIWVDRQERVLVADRENNRVQIFTADGEYLDTWGDHYHPMDIYGGPDRLIYVTDQIPRLSVLAADGRLVGRCRPVLYGAHGVWGDSLGNLYLAEAAPMNRITKLTPLH
ncbi:MAG: peptidyl-alpha-hydroxyglycine alpha-amidating lyase family protein [Thermomicrobiales bacterium]